MNVITVKATAIKIIRYSIAACPFLFQGKVRQFELIKLFLKVIFIDLNKNAEKLFVFGSPAIL